MQLDDIKSIWLVRHNETGILYVKKKIQLYNKEVYFQLQNSCIPNIPGIILCVEEEDGLTVIEEYIHGISLEKALEKHQKEIERQFKKKIYAEKKLANKQRQDSERQAKINARRERASFTFSKRSLPSGVRVTPRELRLKRIVSRFCSNFWIALLMAG